MGRIRIALLVRVECRRVVGKHDNEGKSGVIEMSEERGNDTYSKHNRNLKVEAPLSRAIDAETLKCF